MAPFARTKATGASLSEYTRVMTTVALDEDGTIIPKGTVGTIVDVSASQGCYEVEFSEPHPAVLTLRPEQITPA